MKKINKSKKYARIFKILKCLLFVGLIYLSFDTTYGYLLSKKTDKENTIYLRLALSESNHYFESNYEPKMFLNKAITFLSNIDLNKPTSILRFNNTVNASDNKPIEVLPVTHTDDYDLDKQEKITEFIKDPNPSKVNKPKVYIYNSHQLENYNAKDLELYNITPNVMMASYLLKEKLNDLGVGAIVNEFNLAEFIKANGWNHADSYKASRIFILDAKSNYSSLEYYIDIHRDAVNKDASTIKIGNKNYAKVLFVVGLENKNYEKNLSLANTLNEKINKSYPGLSRGVIKKQGAGVNGVYNQDISPSSMLIEVGAYENTIDEVMCTVEALSKILYEYIKGAE